MLNLPRTKLGPISIRDIGNSIQMAGAIYSNEETAYLVFFPKELEGIPPKLEILALDQEDWISFLRQTDIMETEILAKAADGSLVKAIARKSQRQVDQVVSWNVFRRDGYRCRYCNKNDVPLTVDHLVLWENGGPTIPENLLAACRKCNKARGNTQYGPWLASDYYRRASAELDGDTKRKNEALLGTLDSIPRKHHVHSR